MDYKIDIKLNDDDDVELKEYDLTALNVILDYNNRVQYYRKYQIIRLLLSITGGNTLAIGNTSYTEKIGSALLNGGVLPLTYGSLGRSNKKK